MKDHWYNKKVHSIPKQTPYVRATWLIVGLSELGLLTDRERHIISRRQVKRHCETMRLGVVK